MDGNKKIILRSNYLGLVYKIILCSTLLLIGLVLNLIIDFTNIQKALISAILVLIYIIITNSIDSCKIRIITKTKLMPVKETIIKPVEKKSKKLVIIKHEFVGSNSEKRYHKRTCRLAKLIKQKYKESSDDEGYFKNRKYKACKVCLKK
jgi:hypothetical protein